MKKILVIGLGYVGLCTAVSFAAKGYQVIASDINLSRVELVNKGISPFYEPEIGNMHRDERGRNIEKTGHRILNSERIRDERTANNRGAWMEAFERG